jgi:hypothetical protein
MSNPKSVSSEQLSQLQETLSRTNVLLQRQVSFAHSFTLSVVRGVGYALGATIVAGLTLAILVRIFQTIDLLPVLERYIDTTPFEDQFSRD